MQSMLSVFDTSSSSEFVLVVFPFITSDIHHVSGSKWMGVFWACYARVLQQRSVDKVNKYFSGKLYSALG